MPSNAPVEFVRQIRLLTEAGADFVVIGGVALSIQGGAHVTYDSDYAIIRKRDNAKVLAATLAPFHPKPVDWPSELPYVWDEQHIMNCSVLTLDTDLGRIDFLAEPAGAPPYAELKARADTFDLEGRTVYVACIDDLISMKRAAGRAKDLGHIAELETIRRLLSKQQDES